MEDQSLHFFGSFGLSLLLLVLPLLVLVSLPSGYMRGAGRRGAFLFGTASGLAAVFSMLMPVAVADGLIFDGRSVAIALAAYVAGPLGGAVAAAIGIAFRVWLGGIGTVPGIFSIVAAALVGTAFWVWGGSGGARARAGHLVAMGLALIVVSFATIALIPSGDLAAHSYRIMFWPIVTLIPFSTIAIGLVYLKVLCDIETHARLARSEQILSSITRHIPGFVYQRLVTPDGAITYPFVSEGMTKYFGRTPKEVAADPEALLERMLPEDRENFLHSILEATKSRKPWRMDYRVVTPDGEIRWLRASANPQVRPDGAVLWEGVTIDATDLKDAETALIESCEQADRANRSKSEFLAKMSHELRTPLNAIIGFSDLMDKQAFGPLGAARYENYVGYIHKSAVHLLELINDLLDLSKAEAGKLELSEAEFDLADVVDDACNLVAERAAEGRVMLHAAAIGPHVRLRADRRMVSQMLLNLLSNAIKFTPQGGSVRVDCRIERDDLVLRVIDDGIGLDSEGQAVALSPFGQVHREGGEPNEGTGLGLPLTKELIALHGGVLELDSAPGKGTTVTLRFPAERLCRPAANAA